MVAVSGGRGAPIRLKKVCHAFELHGRQLPVLDEIDLFAGPGDFVALLGPSGCGKSTLLRLIAGLEQPRAGSIIMGQNRSMPPILPASLCFRIRHFIHGARYGRTWRWAWKRAV